MTVQRRPAAASASAAAERGCGEVVVVVVTRSPIFPAFAPVRSARRSLRFLGVLADDIVAWTDGWARDAIPGPISVRVGT